MRRSQPGNGSDAPLGETPLPSPVDPLVNLQYTLYLHSSFSLTAQDADRYGFSIPG